MANGKEKPNEDLSNQIDEYIQKKGSKKTPSRLIQINKLLQSFGLDLKQLARSNKDVAQAIRLLLDLKNKNFQFRFKGARTAIYKTITEGVVGIIQELPRAYAVSVLKKKLEEGGDLFAKNPSPIDRLKTLNQALKNNHQSLFNNVFIYPLSENRRHIPVEAYRMEDSKTESFVSKIIRTILGIGTNQDVVDIQNRVKEVNESLIKKPKATRGVPLRGIMREAPPAPIIVKTQICDRNGNPITKPANKDEVTPPTEPRRASHPKH